MLSPFCVPIFLISFGRTLSPRLQVPDLLSRHNPVPLGFRAGWSISSIPYSSPSSCPLLPPASSSSFSTCLSQSVAPGTLRAGRRKGFQEIPEAGVGWGGMEGRAGLPDSPVWLQRSGLRGEWAAGVARGAVGRGPAPRLPGLGGEGRASACDGRRPGAQIPAWSWPLVPSDLRRSSDVSRSVLLPPPPRCASPLPLPHLCGFQAPSRPRAPGWTFLSPRWTQRRSPYSEECRSSWFSVCSLKPISLEGGGDGAMGAGRFFQGWDCSQSPFPNHPPPVLPPERGVATSLLRDPVSPERWEGLLG